MSEENQVADNTPVFNIEKIYLKNASLEVPHAPEIFLTQEAPDVEMKIGVGGKQIEEGFYDVSITATVTATLEDKRVLFLAEVVQSGIFRMQNLPAEDIDPVINITCPNILFPYVREAITDLTVRAGFPPVYMAPINFEAMYQQQAAQSGNA
ncbi:MAG: protein-export chaperone SecB [Neisseria sp.]|nr:protein-export chaperone SecB [Neisseria sp.]